MTTPDESGLVYRVVTGDLLVSVEDSDDPDRNPDQHQPTGEVTATPILPPSGAFRRTRPSGSQLIIPKTIPGKVTQGRVVDENGNDGLTLLAEVDGTPVYWSIQVSIKDNDNWTIFQATYSIGEWPAGGIHLPDMVDVDVVPEPELAAIRAAEASAARAEAAAESLQSTLSTIETGRLSEAGLDTTYGPSTMAPEAQLPAGIYNHPPTMQDAAAFAGIAPSSMALVQAILAKNATETPLPKMTFLVTGRASDAPRNLGGNTTTNVPSPTDPSRTVWRTVGPVGAAANFRRYVTASLPPSVAISAWVYLPEPEKIASVTLRVWNDQGVSWQRDTSQASITLVKGWNLVRMGSRVSDPARLREVREVGVYATPVAGHSADYSVGIVALEHRPKASVVVINDWGSKPFLDNGYPACKAAGIPVTWGIRVNRLGQGTHPDNHISLEEAKMLMGENNNVMSFHSWNGGANSSYTEEEARQVVLLCQAGLAARGLWSEGAVHRPAWVQNLAPNARGAYPYLVTGGGHSDSYANTSWPPAERNNIPRWGVHGTGSIATLVDNHFAELQTTNGAALVYTHAVIPEANVNHASQANWDYFIGKVTQGIADGWLEAVTIPQLVARERLEIPVDPSMIPLPPEPLP